MNIYDWRRNVASRKGFRYLMSILRAYINCTLSTYERHESPPIIANSFPKSGTHLLIQVLLALPKTRDWGLFLAALPSFSYQEIPPRKMKKKIDKIVPGELVGAHLHHSKEMASVLNQKKAVHYFVYRDPRDVAISEAYYLTYMNRWHRLHKYFLALPDMESRIRFSITGARDPKFPFSYPDIEKRFRRYSPWIHYSEVYSLKFEDLNGGNREQVVSEIIRFYSKRSNQALSRRRYMKKALTNINPASSHTFRKGRSGGWKNELTEEHKKLFKDIAGKLLIDLGYEKNRDW